MVAVITTTAEDTVDKRIGRAMWIIAQRRKMWYNTLQHLSLEEEKMRWYPVEFVAHFPEPQKRTKKDWQLIDAYFRAYDRDFQKAMKERETELFMWHLEDTFLSEEEDYDSEW